MKYLWYAFIIAMAGFGFYHFKGSLPSFDVNLRSPSSTTRQPAKTMECKYTTGDLANPIIGYGATLNEARADASQKCFDTRMDKVEAKNVQGTEYYNRGLINIDECVNIRCS